MKRELLIGCGYARDKRISISGDHSWQNLTTLDSNPACKPDILYDLQRLPLPVESDSLDEIHAYEVLEHIGYAGDSTILFEQFSEFYRILKPDGLLCASVPDGRSPKAWGEPGHTRIINQHTLTFLSQAEYNKQVGVTSMSDYRDIYRADFDLIASEIRGDSYFFVVRAAKPSRWKPREQK